MYRGSDAMTDKKWQERKYVCMGVQLNPDYYKTDNSSSCRRCPLLIYKQINWHTLLRTWCAWGLQSPDVCLAKEFPLELMGRSFWTRVLFMSYLWMDGWSGFLNIDNKLFTRLWFVRDTAEVHFRANLIQVVGTIPAQSFVIWMGEWEGSESPCSMVVCRKAHLGYNRALCLWSK